LVKPQQTPVAKHWIRRPGLVAALLCVVAAAVIIGLAYRLFFPGAAFFFFTALVLGPAIPLVPGLLLRRRRSAWRFAAYALSAALALVILIGGGLRLAQAFYWVNHHPDDYGDYQITGGLYDGVVAVKPDVVERDSYQTITLTYRAGAVGLGEGGGLILRLGQVISVDGEPRFYDCFYQDMWEETLQVDDPQGQGYVSLRASEGLEFSLSKPPAPPHGQFLFYTFALDAARYRQDPSEPNYMPLNTVRRHEIHLKLEQGALLPGEELTLILGDKSAGGPGWAMPAGEAAVDLVLYADPSGSGLFRMVDSIASLQTGGSAATALELLTPATPALGEKFTFVVRALDDDGFLSLLHRGAVDLLPADGVTFDTDNYTFSATDQGAALLTAVVHKPGLYRLQVRDKATGRVYTGNPMLVDPDLESNIFWGDLHRHSTLGKDANLTPADVYRYSRVVDLLDFASLSEHDFFDYWGLPLAPEEWRSLLEINNRHNIPGQFVAINGYEWSNLRQGHRNIYWAPDEAPRLYPYSEAATAAELQQTLSESRCLVIPHHSAWRFMHANIPYNWGDPGWEQQRLVEIYSKHGSSDHFHSPYPIHHDETPFFVYLFGAKSNRAYEGSGSYVREALAEGYRFGFIAGSDSHWARGGRAFGTGVTRDYTPGLQAVYASELSRESLFEAMWQRQTYATTGARILVDFRVNVHPMGSEISSGGKSPLISYTVYGTAPLEGVELWKYSSSEGYKLTYFPAEGQLNLAGELSDPAYRENSFYFIRVVQTDGHLAWASPIWVDD